MEPFEGLESKPNSEDEEAALEVTFPPSPKSKVLIALDVAARCTTGEEGRGGVDGLSSSCVFG
jgi:hypothetical protein